MYFQTQKRKSGDTQPDGIFFLIFLNAGLMIPTDMNHCGSTLLSKATVDQLGKE